MTGRVCGSALFSICLSCHIWMSLANKANLSAFRMRFVLFIFNLFALLSHKHSFCLSLHSLSLCPSRTSHSLSPFFIVWQVTNSTLGTAAQLNHRKSSSRAHIPAYPASTHLYTHMCTRSPSQADTCTHKRCSATYPRLIRQLTRGN